MFICNNIPDIILNKGRKKSSHTRQDKLAISHMAIHNTSQSNPPANPLGGMPAHPYMTLTTTTFMVSKAGDYPHATTRLQLTESVITLVFIPNSLKTRVDASLIQPCSGGGLPWFYTRFALLHFCCVSSWFK